MADSFLKQLVRQMVAGVPAFRSRGAFGYSSGGTVTQLVNKATGVTLNAPTGEITLDAANLNAGAGVAFVLTNAYIEAGDYLALTHISGGTLGAYNASAICTLATGTITLFNNTAGNLAEAVVLKFYLHKAATA